MKPNQARRLIAVALCVLLVPILWKYWSFVCNELCKPGRALGMQVLTVALPLSLGLIAVTFTSQKKPSTKARTIALAGALVLIAAAILVSLDR